MYIFLRSDGVVRSIILAFRASYPGSNPGRSIEFYRIVAAFRMQTYKVLCNYTNHCCNMIGDLRRRRDYMGYRVACALLLLLVMLILFVLFTGSASALTADAGADQNVSRGTSVTLDGSGSSGTNLTYEWTEGSTSWSGESFIKEFSVGKHTITLTVSDGTDTDSDAVIVRVNDPPIADAGDDRVVSPNTYVKLDSKGSKDNDGSISSYIWKEGTEELSTKRSFLKIFEPGKHTITLTVTDNFGDYDRDEIIVIVNRAPQADAGADQSVNVGTLVHFNASNSSDPDGDTMSYLWKEDGGSTLNSAPSFAIRDLPCGTHRVMLEVTDIYGTIGTDYVVIYVVPVDQEIPIANAGEDQTVLVGTNVTLDASGSSDPDGTIITYEWLDANTTIGESVIYEHLFARGVHKITLVVTDDGGASATDDVKVTVRTTMVLPQADAGDNRTVLEGTEVVLDASGSKGENLTYQWMENGTILSDDAVFRHIFDSGTHTIALTVADEYGCADTEIVNIAITQPGTTGSAGVVGTQVTGKSEFNYVTIFVLALVLIVAIGGGILFMQRRQSGPSGPSGRAVSGVSGTGHGDRITQQKPSKSKSKSEPKTGSGALEPANPEPDLNSVQLKALVLDAMSKTPIPDVIVHAGHETRKTDGSGEVTFALKRGDPYTVHTSGVPNLYASASTDGGDTNDIGNTGGSTDTSVASASASATSVATILLSSIVRPDQGQDAKLRSIRQAFDERYREVSSYDRCIPEFYRSVAQRLIEYVRGITAIHFVRGKNTPKEVMDRLIPVIALVCSELSEIMVSKRNIDLYAANRDAAGTGSTGNTENGSGCGVGPVSHDSLTELLADPSGFIVDVRPGVQQLLTTIDNDITSKTRDMAVLPIAGVWSIAKGLLSEQSEGEIDYAMRILVADALLRYAKEMYENQEIVKRLKKGIL